jgi:hypothetical protein
MNASGLANTPTAGSRRKRVILTALALFLIALGFFVSAFFKPWP